MEGLKMHKILILLPAVLLVFTCKARGDIVVLKDGSRVEGIVTEEEKSLKVELEYGHVVFPRRLVDYVIKCDTPGQEYEKRLAETDRNDIEQLKALREWCAGAGLKEQAKELALKIGWLALEKKAAGIDTKNADTVFDFALWCRRSGYADSVVDSYLWKVLAIDPDHTAAREMMGYRKFRGQWLKKEEISRIEEAEFDREMRLKGLVKYNGQWLTPDAAACLKQLEDIEEQREELARERRRIEDDMREVSLKWREIETRSRDIRARESRLEQWEDTVERTALQQAALAQRLAFDRNELARLRAEVYDLKEELEKEKDELREEREEIDREKRRLDQLRWQLDRERRLLRQERQDKDDCRPGTERPAKLKAKIGSEEHQPGRQSDYDSDTRTGTRRKRR
jgi:hypothetical protein